MLLLGRIGRISRRGHHDGMLFDPHRARLYLGVVGLERKSLLWPAREKKKLVEEAEGVNWW